MMNGDPNSIAMLSPEKRELYELLVQENGAPLSFAQERLWFLDQLEPDTPVYNIPAAIALTGSLDVPALRRSLDEIVRRHEVLRTTLASLRGQPVQIIAPAWHQLLPLIDLQAIPEAGRQAEAQRLIYAEARRSFNLSTGPLLRAHLLRLAEGEHLLLLTMHHIVSDAWSLGVLMQELATLYTAFAGGKPSPLPDLPIQYADFAAWQREGLRDQVLEEQLAYWTRQLEGAPEVLALPTDHPRPALQTFHGAKQLWTASPRLTASLNDLSRREGVTLFMTLLAAFQALLQRYTGQDDLVVGSPIANRTRQELEGLIGFFANTLVLRADLSGNPTFRELLRRVRRMALDAYTHQDVPFEKLVEARQPGRDLSHPPLFQVMFILQNAPMPTLELRGLSLRPRDVDAGVAKFDLTLALEETPAGLRGWFEYNTDLFEADTIVRMTGHFQTLLEGIVAQPGRRLSELPILSRAERQQLLVDWNATEAAYAPDECLHRLFEQQAGRTPDSLALVFQSERLTYHELNARANRLACYLQHLGVGPEVRVGLCLERSVAMVVGVLGVLKAGGAYVPLDPAYPRERVSFMLQDAHAPIVLTQPHLADRFAVESIQIVYLTEDGSISAAATPSGQPASGVTSDHLAYVIYTSGSTGRPKGVAITHRNAVALLSWAKASFPPTDLAGVLAATSICFDLSIFELFAPLCTGGTVFLADNALQLPELPARSEIRLINSVPSVVAELLRLGPLPASVRSVNLAGEPLPLELAQALYAQPAVERVYNLYGPSEDTTYSTCALVPAGETEAPGIGRPIHNKQVYVLDRHLHPAPIGVAGEVYIGGDGLARGYLDRPDLTAERFIPNPFSRRPGARLYKTGDLARTRPDGNLAFLGRIDHQVKVRGFRIELGEIEAALRRHPAVRDSVVLARDDRPGERYLVAYVVLDEPSAGPMVLRRFLAAQLPEYLLPSAIVMLPALPLTPNGKVDRRALPAPDQVGVAGVGRFVPPRTSIEEVLIGRWRQILGREQIGARDNFFELGGHSLLATRLISQLRETFQVELPIRALFESPVLADLAARIEAALGIEKPPAPPILAVTHEGDLPLSFSQQRLWFLDQLEPGNPLYNIPSAVRLTGSPNVVALRDSLAEIVRRHAILRTRFTAVEGKPIQVVAPQQAMPLCQIDLRPLSQTERAAETQRLIAEEGQRPFDLARGRLIRAAVLHLTETEHILLLTMHHIVSDGWSLGIVVHELSALYTAHLDGRPSPLPELPIQYADYAHWQREWMNGPALAEQLAYWQQRLSGELTALDLPADRPRPPVQTFHGASEARSLPRPLTDALKSLSDREGATLFMTLLAAFQALLYRYTGQEDILIGSPIANRNRAEIEGLIGFFVNTLVLRADLSGRPTFRALLGRVRQAALDAYAHQDLPFEKLLEALQPQRDLSRTPLFQVFFNMLNFPLSELDLPGLKLELLPGSEAGAKFDLTLYIREQDSRLTFEMVYNADLFERRRIHEMLEQFEHLLSQIVKRPAEPITDFSLITASAKAYLPDPAQALDAAWQGAVHAGLARQARCAPEKIAVVDPHQTWTYQELEARSNQLANYLRAHGVGSQDIVAIYGHRSASIVWAVLGVLKAGAAFTILDPAYPSARLIESLSIAQPRGWIQLAAAGALPEALQTFVAAAAYRCRIELPGTPDVLTGCSTEPPEVNVAPDDLACVGFTSGSTGKPKAIMGRHGSLSHFLPWQSRVFQLTETDRYSLLSGLAHDPLQRDIFTPLWLGATICIPDPAQVGVPGWLADWMQREQIGVANLTPAMGQVLVEAGPDAPASKRELSALRYAFFVGDVLTKQDVDKLRRLAPKVACVNFYGSTETQRAVGYFIVPDPAKAIDGYSKSIVPLGQGMPNVQLLIVNAASQLVGVGEIGEIYVRSPHLALGYLGDPVLTQEKFIANPFTQTAGDRVYRTGDLGRYLPDGNVVFAGRADHQVKVRGFRVELGEIEAVLSAWPSVREAVVIARDDEATADVPRREKRLVAYLVLQEGNALNAGELRAYLKTKLPDYMIPAAWVQLAALPLTPNRKIDRRALPAPEPRRPATAAALVAPRTPVEEILAGIWSALLNVDPIGADDNFFELGGHSLLAMQCLSQIHSAFGVEIPVRALFETPTLAALAARIQSMQQAGRSVSTSPLAPVARTAQLALSFAQQRLWFLDQFEPGNPEYNIPLAMRLQGPLDVAAFARAFNAIVQRHEALRTAFPAVAGRPALLIQPALHLPLAQVDLGALPQAQRETEMRRLALAEAQQPFDLARAPLLRICLLRLAETEHVLLLTLHHIVADGWSIGVLLREWTALYAAFAEKRRSPLPALPIQYADYAEWQRQWLQGQILDRQLAYWKQQLDALPILQLPTDYPRPAVRTSHGAGLTFQLPVELTEALRTLGRQHGVTLFMMLLAAFDAVLYRYTGQTDLAVGSPVANRNRAEVEGLIGFFVNTLVLRTDLSGNPSFLEVLKRVRETCLGAYAHQDVPFEKLVEVLEPERSLSHTPLFQVMFILQTEPPHVPSLPGLEASRLTPERVTAKFDLTWSWLETGHGLIGEVEYNRDLFDARTIERMAEHFQRLLEGCAANPDRPIATLPLLTETEQQLFAAWNDTQADTPQSVCIHELFEAQVARTPEAVAVVVEDRALTYAELNRRADRLACYLQDLGVGPEALVGLCVERSLEMVIGLLGVLKAGGAYVPLDPAYPKERLAFTLHDARPQVLLTQQPLEAHLPQAAPCTVCLDADWPAIAQSPTSLRSASGAVASNLQLHPSPDNRAYIIYTSGSTGQPKGVQISHRAVVNFLSSMSQRPGLTAQDCLLAVTTLSFDIAGLELFLPLSLGARVVIASREAASDGQQLAATLLRCGVTAMQATPATWRMLLEIGWAGQRNLKMLCGGEALSRDLADRLLPNGESLWNLYGPTETTIWSAATRVERGESAVSLGRPIANTRFYILDPQGQPAPLGVPGELYIGGGGLTRGYLNRPDLTAERLVPHPFSPEPGARLYRTGDRVRYLPNGDLEFLGRIDHQLKVRGFRIEPGEIEATLERHPAIRESVVIAREAFSAWDKRLVAYVIAQEGQRPIVSELRSFLQAQLPDYMIPSAYVWLNAWPLTPNGKLNRRALPAPDLASAERLEPFAASQTPIEELLAGIWAQVLGVPSIDRRDNFFELGGHSLLATQVLARLRALWRIDLPLRALFEAPTLAGLAARLEAARRAEPLPAAPPLHLAPRTGSLPLSFAQQRLWFLDQFQPDNPEYNIPIAVHLRGALDLAALAQSLHALLQRHETLRTTFALADEQPVQVITPADAIPLPQIDLSTLPTPQRDAQARRWADEEARRPFNLARGPLWRINLLRLAEQEHILILNIHHIVADGWSIGILIRELADLYQIFVTSRSAALPDLPVQYADFAAWQREWLKGDVLQRQLGYWRRQLADVTTLELPTDHPRPAVRSARGATYRFHFDRVLADRIRALSQSESVTPFMTLLAAFQTLLHRLTGQADVAIGSPIANRSHPAIENLIGFFANTLVLRTHFDAAPGRLTFRDVLSRVREVCLEAYAHQYLPFEQLVEEMLPQRDLSHTPLFQVAFAFQSAPGQALQLPGLTLEAFPIHTGTTKFDLSLFVTDAGQELSCSFEYNTDVFEADTIARLAGHFQTLLEGCVAQPGSPLTELPLLMPAERHQLLVAWNETQADFPAEVCIHQLFEAQVARDPLAPALVFGEDVLGYGELNEQANQLAHQLRRLGVAPDERVGVWLGRSPKLIVALLGILKAGGAYVPLELNWPAERLKVILQSLGLHCLITQATQLRHLHDLLWELPTLTDIVCLDVTQPQPPTEPLDEASVQALWDQVARQATGRVTAGGFISSYTGQPFTEAEVDEYVARVVSLAQPYLGADRRVLEIGCGSGLIMFALAPQVQRYVGLDPSPLTQERNRAYAAQHGFANVEVRTGFAHQPGVEDDERFDLILLPSAIQFFPGHSYLQQVIAQALNRLSPGGTVLIADVLDPRQKGAFKQSLVAFDAEQRQTAGRRTKLERDSELYVDADWFHALRAQLPEIADVTIQLRTQGFDNELRYRYDVVLTKASAECPATAAPVDVRPPRVWTAWHLQSLPTHNLPATTDPADEAYIIYTSGSTGVPKGVVVRHQPVVNLIHWVNTTFEVGARDRLLFVTSVCFDLSVYDIFGILASGGSLRIASEDELREPEYLIRILACEPVTFWDSAPAALRQLVPFFSASRFDAPALRLVFLSGDWIPVALPDAVRATFPRAQVVSLGGATEATVWSNVYPIGQVDPRWTSIPYGKPIQNAQYYVLDASLQPCPIGVPGDLYIGGICLASGYTDAELTAERFIPSPLSKTGGAGGGRIYKTGDRARYWADGNLEFLGRLDHQVKIRGFRIELGEIETALGQHPAVRDAAVLARASEAGSTDKQLVAYVVPRTGQTLFAAELRSYLRERLPDYMLPATFVTLASLPVTPNGKLNRQALPAPEATRPESGQVFVAPRTPLEEIVAGLWAELLGLDQVGIYDNFFELGGHSLLATQVHSRLRQMLRLEFPLRALFEAPTIADFVQRLQVDQRAEAGSSIPALVPIAGARDLPLSFAQQRLWFLNQLEPDSAAYNIPAALRLHGDLDVALLAQSLKAVVRRHATLRTTFVTVDGQPAQVIASDVALPVPSIDLSALPAAAREAEVRRLAVAEAVRPFNLAQGPLIRVAVLRADEGEHVLLLNMHHIVSDGWSTGIFIREAAAWYQAGGRGESPQLPDLPIQYADFAVWQRAWLRDEALAEQLAYWRQQLAGASDSLELPTDRPRPSIQTFRGAAQPFRLTAQLTAGLDALSRQAGATLFMTLLAAFQALLHRYAEQDDIIVGSPIANRNRVELEHLIGFFVNTLALRTDLSGDPSFLELVERVREVALGAYAHQDLPFEMLVEELRPERDLSRSPLFQVAFALQNMPTPTLALPGLTFSPLSADSGTAKFDLTLFMWEEGRELAGRLEYSTDLFDAETIDRLLKHFQALLASIVAQPDERLSTLVAVIPKQKLGLAVAATFTAEPLAESLAFWTEQLGLPAKIQFAPYHQVFQQLLDPGGVLLKNDQGVNVVLVRLEDWLRGETHSPGALSPAAEARWQADPRSYTLPNTLRIFQQNKYETDYLYQEIFEEQTYLKHGIRLDDGACVFDVGANIGLFTLFVQQMCQAASVYAFEPAPATFDILRANAELYGPGIQVFNCGLSNAPKTATFTFYPWASVFSGYYADQAKDGQALKSVILNQQRQEVAQVGLTDDYERYVDEMMAGRMESQSIACRLETLSNVIAANGVERIDLLKIDAEKSELDILAGIVPADWPKIQQVVMEIHDIEGHRLKQVVALLEAQGFHVAVDSESLLKDASFYNVYARRQPAHNGSTPDAPLPAEISQAAEANVREFLRTLTFAAERTPASFLVGVCPPSAGVMAQPALAACLQNLEDVIASEVAMMDRASLLDLSNLAEKYHVAKTNDPYLDRIGHIPFTAEFFTALGTSIARAIFALRNKPYKVIVLDCDQTLWKGVCAEDGPSGVVFEPGHYALHRLLKAQQEAGMLLCLCSKNEEEDVLKVFQHHPELPLQIEHLVAWRINWEAKSTNLKALANELQLSLDSFVVLDDNPLECAEIRAHCPEVLVLQIPGDSAGLPAFLDHVWAFDHFKVTAEDRRRTALYHENRRREEFRHTSLTLDDFLAGLQLKIALQPVALGQLERVLQLTQRVNQFNATGVRYADGELQSLLASGRRECLTVSVSDRFGDYGLVGALIFGAEADTLNVDAFLLSCRAMGRYVEDNMLVKLAQLAQAKGCRAIRLPYRPTRRNTPVLHFLERVGAAAQLRPDADDGATRVFSVEGLLAQPNLFQMNFGYRFGALSVEPAAETAAQDAQPASPATAAPRLEEKLEHLNRIAHQFQTAETILKTIRSRKRKRIRSGKTFVAPRTSIEERLAEIWAELLHLDRVGVYDNFFDLGGHSLLATQVFSRLQSHYQIELPLRIMFEAPTLVEMSRAIEAAQRAAQALSTPALRPAARTGDLPLSFAQERLWFLDQLAPDNPFYNVAVAVHLGGSFDVEPLARSLNEIVRRHQILRTTFLMGANQPCQAIAPSLSLALPVVDLTGLPGPERESEAHRLALSEARRPFNLARGPLIRVCLVQLQADEHELLVTLHHIVSDGWSMGVLVRELTALYAAFSAGKPSPLSDLPIQYADFAVWQREWLSSDGAAGQGRVLATQLAYWKRQLAGLSTLRLPTDHPRPPSQTFQGATLPFVLSPELSEALQALSRQEGVTLFMLLLAGFQMLLACYTGQDDIVVGSGIANRTSAELEGLIGFFVNTLVLRSDLSGNPTFREVLKRVREVCLGAYAHQDLPFENLVAELQPERDLNRQPLFQVIFALQNTPTATLELPGLKLTPSVTETQAVRFDLELHTWEGAKGIGGTFIYNTVLFEPATIARMARDLRTVLEQVTFNPQCSLFDIPPALAPGETATGDPSQVAAGDQAEQFDFFAV